MQVRHGHPGRPLLQAGISGAGDRGGYHWDYIQAGGRGINHICFKVHDFDHWQEHFRALGHNLFFGYEDEDQENGYRRCLYARDPVLDMVYEIKEINRYRDANGVLEEGKG